MTIKRYFFSIYEKGMVEEPDGSMVLYADHAAEMAAAQARIAELTKERDAAHAEVAKLNAQRETMARWLEKYGQHASDCRCWCRAEDPEACDCGLSAALAAGNDRNATMPQCDCHRCASDRPRTEPRGMVVCPTCGNKRCPKASDHRLDCTNVRDHRAGEEKP